MNKILRTSVWLFMLAPVIYLVIIWRNLPDRLALHFNLQGNPDRWGNKTELWGSAALMIVVTAGTYLLLTNIHRIDPKRYAKEMQDKYNKIAFTVVIFLSVVHFFVIYSSSKGEIGFPPGVIFAAVSLLFAFLGNYMYNIKPNYFVGIRVPWTLESEENWRKTHNLAGRLWFVAGIIMAILTLILPPAVGLVVFLAGIFILVVIPVVYSYKTFVKEKNQQ